MNGNGYRVLVADDDPDILDFIDTYLSSEGYDCVHATDGGEVLRVFSEAQKAGRNGNGHIDLILLDVIMPRLDGFEACRRLRQQSSVPIIMLTARGDDVDRIVGLEIGADDYIAKPFNPRELVARMRAVLRRSQSDSGTHDSNTDVLERRGLRLDAGRRNVSVRGERVELTAREFDLLRFLLRHPGRVFSRAQLIDNVWGDDACVGPRTIDVHVRRLRERIEPDPANPVYIETVWAVGYRFTDAE